MKERGSYELRICTSGGYCLYHQLPNHQQQRTHSWYYRHQYSYDLRSEGVARHSVVRELLRKVNNRSKIPTQRTK